MIYTSDMLEEQLGKYAFPSMQLSRLAKKGEYIQIKKGLYCDDISTPGYLLAGSIYGPSYISFEYAMSYYGLIPEKVTTVTCATFRKKKKKVYDTAFGVFTYRDVPDDVFPFGINIEQEGEYYYQIATAEKSLCDKMYSMSPIKNLKEMDRLLFEDMRIEFGEYIMLNLDDIEFLSEKYKSNNVRMLARHLRKAKDNNGQQS